MNNEDADKKVLAAIKRRYKETYEVQHLGGMEAVHEHMPLDALYRLRGIEVGEVWASLSRLVKDGKIIATGSNRHKSYAPVIQTEGE